MSASRGWALKTLLLDRRLNDLKASLVQHQDSNEIKELFQEQDFLLVPANSYLETLFETATGFKTVAHASDYLSEDSIIRDQFILRYWLSVPHLLVGFGILGTFAGLVAGIRTFDASSVEGVRSSIEVLLSGMATAFWSSIAGLGTSVLLTSSRRHYFARLQIAYVGFVIVLMNATS